MLDSLVVWFFVWSFILSICFFELLYTVFVLLPLYSISLPVQVRSLLGLFVALLMYCFDMLFPYMVTFWFVAVVLDVWVIGIFGTCLIPEYVDIAVGCFGAG